MQSAKTNAAQIKKYHNETQARKWNKSFRAFYHLAQSIMKAGEKKPPSEKYENISQHEKGENNLTLITSFYQSLTFFPRYLATF